MATQVSLTDGAVASAGALAIQTNGTTQAVSISTGQVATLAQNPILTSGTANGVAYLNGSKAVTSGSALVFDGTNLGVGVTPSAWSASYKAIQLGGGTSIWSGSSGNQPSFYSNNLYFNGTNRIYLQNGYATEYVQSTSGTHSWYTAASGTAGNAITFTQAMTLDASGNLGVGLTSLTQRFQVERSWDGSTWAKISNGNSTSGAASGVLLATDQGDAGALSQNSSNAGYGTAANALRLRNLLSAPLTFETGGTERARIDSSGNLLVGDTSAYSGSRLSVKTGNNNGTTHAWYAKNSSATVLGYQRDDGLFNTGAATNSPYNFTTASAANLFVDSSGTFYRSTSSLKYKTNVQDTAHGLTELLALRPVTYEGKSESDAGKTFGGLIAEEVHDAGLTEFVQYAEDGTPDALAYGNMVSLCIKAIQEQQALINQLQADVAALKGA
jgi:hypothetical protein